jgi:hypothetical protein
VACYALEMTLYLVHIDGAFSRRTDDFPPNLERTGCPNHVLCPSGELCCTAVFRGYIKAQATALARWKLLRQLRLRHRTGARAKTGAAGVHTIASPADALILEHSPETGDAPDHALFRRHRRPSQSNARSIAAVATVSLIVEQRDWQWRVEERGPEAFLILARLAPTSAVLRDSMLHLWMNRNAGRRRTKHGSRGRHARRPD